MVQLDEYVLDQLLEIMSAEGRHTLRRRKLSPVLKELLIKIRSKGVEEAANHSNKARQPNCKSTDQA